MGKSEGMGCVRVLTALAALLAGCSGAKLDSAWVRANSTGWSDPESTQLEPRVAERVDAMIGDARIVYLGEPDHYIHEKYPYRLALLRHLFARGFRHVGMEMGTSDAARIDRFLELGDPASLERVVLHGYSGATPQERRELERFQPRTESDREATTAFAAEEKRFAHAMRELSESRAPGTERLHFFGFDTEGILGGGYQDLRDTLAPHADRAEAQGLLARLALVEGESLGDEALRVFKLAEEVREDPAPYRAAFGEAVATRLLEQLDALSESFVFQLGRLQSRTLADRHRFYARREEFMHKTLDRWLEAHPGEKLILLGHNTHLSRDSSTLRAGPSDGEHEPMWRSIGTHVVEPRPQEVFVFWLLAPEGEHLMPDGRQPVTRRVPLREGSVEAALAPHGDAFLLDLRQRPPGTLLDEVTDYGNPSSYAHGPVGRNADAVVFFRKISPPRKD
ncbi:erythromycin esterase family protein [Archangium violaceum]|uniref:erythromycin esterase family protein n=1 Tax=Archangium violaceum TaxID=83451 RepID=UPI0019501E3E|nr:erythromycin esterase family protein [Archangium violaceum]QRN94237.1 erythromycin esterase family protein [Archangium violaceum]